MNDRLEDLYDELNKAIRQGIITIRSDEGPQGEGVDAYDHRCEFDRKRLEKLLEMRKILEEIL